MREFQHEKLADALAMMNIAEVARRSGLREDTIRAWVTGKHWPQTATFKRLTDLLGIDPEWFYEPYEEGATKGGGQ